MLSRATIDAPLRLGRLHRPPDRPAASRASTASARRRRRPRPTNTRHGTKSASAAEVCSRPDGWFSRRRQKILLQQPLRRPVCLRMAICICAGPPARRYHFSNWMKVSALDEVEEGHGLAFFLTSRRSFFDACARVSPPAMDRTQFAEALRRGQVWRRQRPRDVELAAVAALPDFSRAHVRSSRRVAKAPRRPAGAELLECA